LPLCHCARTGLNQFTLNVKQIRLPKKNDGVLGVVLAGS